MSEQPRDRSLLADSAILFVANGVGSALGYGYHLAVARVGGPQVYADLGALISLNVVLSVISLTIQFFVAAKSARLVDEGVPVRPYIGKAALFAVVFAAGCVIVLGQLIGPVASFLNLMQDTGIWVIFLGMIPLLAHSVMRGGLQGTQNFRALGILRAVEPGVQFVIGVSLVALGFGAPGGVFGTVSGFVVALGFAAWFMRPKFRGMLEPHPVHLRKGNLAYVIQISLFLASVTAFTNVDVFLVKHHFAHEQAAMYIAPSYMSRFLYLSAMAIGFALFPKTAAGADDGVHRALLRKAMIYFLGFAVPFVGICIVFNHEIINLFYGDKYAGAADILPRMLLCYATIGLAYLMGTFRLSRNRRLVWAPFAVVSLIEALLIGFWPGSVERVSWYMLFLGMILPAATFLKFPERTDG